MPVYFVQEASGVGKAVFRPTESAEDAFLCSIDLTAYSEPRVRDLFAELVNAVADHFRRKYLAEVAAPASRLAGLPCETCEAPEADDVRFRAGQISDASELQLSSNGYPIGCCKRRIVGAFGGRPDTSRPAARWSR
jgi:hypothetical protein